MRRGLGPGVFFIFGCKYLNYTLNPAFAGTFFILHKTVSEVHHVCTRASAKSAMMDAEGRART